MRTANANGFRTWQVWLVLVFAWLGTAFPLTAEPPVTIESLTPSEQAILRAFVADSPSLRTRDTPAMVASRREENLWLSTLRDDSKERLCALVPGLEAKLLVGRNRRLVAARDASDAVDSIFMNAGVDPDPASSVLLSYRKQLKKISKQRPKIPPWAHAIAEELTRKRFAEVFYDILKDEAEAPKSLPFHRWPKEAVVYYQNQIEQMEFPKSPRSKNVKLPSNRYEQWRQWIHEDLKSKILSLIAIPKPHLDDWGLSYFEKAKKQRLQVLLHLRRAFRESFLSSGSQSGIVDYLRNEKKISEKVQDKLRISSFGGESALGGDWAKVADPKLAWLHDLHWYLYGIGPGKKVGRFFNAHADRILNPGVYWDRVLRKTSEIMAKAIMGGVSLFGAAVVTVHGVNTLNTKQDFFAVNRPQMTQTTLGLVQNVSTDNPDHFKHRSLFTVRDINFPTELELPALEDLKGPLTPFKLEGKKSAGAIRSDVPFLPTWGKYVPIARTPGRVPRRVRVVRDEKALRPGKDFDVVQTQKGFHFIRLKVADVLPWLISSRVITTVDYRLSPERILAVPPESPPLTHEEVRRILSTLEAGGISGELKIGITQLLREAQNKLTFSHLERAIRSNSFYTRTPAQLRRPFFSNNYVDKFLEFRDLKRNFCADCDVAAKLLDEMRTDVKSTQNGWHFEIRRSLHRNPQEVEFTLGRLHGRLYGWKDGYSEPLIFDPTPDREDPRSPAQVEAERKQNEEPNPIPLPESKQSPRKLAHHRLKFAQASDQEEGEGVPPDPDLLDPVIARAVLQRQNKDLLLANIKGELIERQRRNGDRRKWLKNLIAVVTELKEEVKDLDLLFQRDSVFPHDQAVQTASRLYQYMETGDAFGLKQVLEAAKIQIPNWPTGLELQQALQLLRDDVALRIDAVKSSRTKGSFAAALAVSDSALLVFRVMASHPWTPLENETPNQVRRDCHEAIVLARRAAIARVP